MPKILVAGATIKCSHGGLIRLPGGATVMKISGAGVLTKGAEQGLSFAAGDTPCPMTTPAGAPSPCTTAPATAGVSKKVSVGKLGVLLDSATGPATNGQDPSATWSVVKAGQTLVDASE